MVTWPMRASTWMFILLCGAPFGAQAETLTYSGRLAPIDGLAPASWPDLLFALDDEAGEPLWSTMVPGEVLSMTHQGAGRFTVALNHGELADGREASLDASIIAMARTLSIGVCHALPCAEPDWLGPPQPLGAVPRALRAAVADDVDHDAVRAAVQAPAVLVVAQEPDPDEFGSLPEALAALEGRTLATGRPVTIRIGRGIYNHEAPIHVRRHDGAALRIIGAGREETILRFPSSDGLIVSDGGHLGLIDQLTISGPGDGSPGNGDGDADHRGAIAVGGATLRLGSALSLHRFPGACLWVEGSDVMAEQAEFSDCGGSGIVAYYGARVRAHDAAVLNVGTYGILAGYGSMLSCRRCTLSGGQTAVYAHFNAHIQAQDITLDVDAFRSMLFRARFGGNIEAHPMRDPGRCQIDEHSFVRFVE